MEGPAPCSSAVSDLDEEPLDPRVQVELENLNAATNEINSLEASLEEANNAFRASLNETALQLQSLYRKLGSCVDKARPYYEAKEKAKKLQLDCQRAAIQYQRANAVHQAARETIALAEERFTNLREKEGSKDRKFDAAWQEMLNHATMKIMEAEAQKSASEREHQKRAAAYTEAEKEVKELEKRLKTAINKSRPYFNHRMSTQVKLEAQKDRICKLQRDVLVAKNRYSSTLLNLEQISEEIHELRRLNMKREPGVGAEMDHSQNFIEKAPSRESLLDVNVEAEKEYWNTLKEKLSDIDTDGNCDQNENCRTDHTILLHKDNLSVPYENFTCSPSVSKNKTTTDSDPEDCQNQNRNLSIQGNIESKRDNEYSGDLTSPSGNESETFGSFKRNEIVEKPMNVESIGTCNLQMKVERLIIPDSDLEKRPESTNSLINLECERVTAYKNCLRSWESEPDILNANCLDDCETISTKCENAVVVRDDYDMRKIESNENNLKSKNFIFNEKYFDTIDSSQREFVNVTPNSTKKYQESREIVMSNILQQKQKELMDANTSDNHKIFPEISVTNESPQELLHNNLLQTENSDFASCEGAVEYAKESFSKKGTECLYVGLESRKSNFVAEAVRRIEGYGNQYENSENSKKNNL